MKLKLDVSDVAFMVSKAPAAKEFKGEQQKDKDGALKWVTELFALDQAEDEGGSIIRVVTAGEKPKLSKTQPVSLVDLEIIPWSQNGNSGVAYRAAAINPKSGK